MQLQHRGERGNKKAVVAEVGLVMQVPPAKSRHKGQGVEKVQRELARVRGGGKDGRV